nr:MAG TPA: hypothetical protein [Caudoviricetes sp.]
MFYFIEISQTFQHTCIGKLIFSRVFLNLPIYFIWQLIITK